MLSTVVTGGAALILALLCGVLILPLPGDPARLPIDVCPSGEAASGPAARQRWNRPDIAPTGHANFPKGGFRTL